MFCEGILLVPQLQYCIVVIILDVYSSTWTSHRKHVFILSISGKPIYSRYGKEERLVTTYGIMQALVSLVQDDKDILKLEKEIEREREGERERER